MRTQPASISRLGFTLLELVLALGISAFVLTSIFFVADGAVRSTSKMVEIQNEDISRDAFFTFLRNHFDSLPGNAVLDLQDINTSPPYLPVMTFQNTPVSFNWGGVPLAAEATRLATVATVTGGMDVVLEYYDQAILDSDEGPAERGIEPFASIVLLSDVREFIWRVVANQNYSPDHEEWEYVWNDTRNRPTFIELEVIFSNDDPAIKRLFWIPNKANPQTTMNALRNVAGAPINADGEAETDDGGEQRGGNGGGTGGGTTQR